MALNDMALSVRGKAFVWLQITLRRTERLDACHRRNAMRWLF